MSSPSLSTPDLTFTYIHEFEMRMVGMKSDCISPSSLPIYQHIPNAFGTIAYKNEEKNDKDTRVDGSSCSKPANIKGCFREIIVEIQKSDYTLFMV